MTGILYGVCGIGQGHAYRQLPIVRMLAASRPVVVLTYGAGLDVFRREARSLQHLTVREVSVPHIPGGPRGIDWKGCSNGQHIMDPWRMNGMALDHVSRRLGRPDLVVSDYEPVVASYAYATGATLVTLDQQSKFLVGDLSLVDGAGPLDEIQRLRMFFPRADLRLACSFFPVPRLDRPHEEVTVIAPVLRATVLDASPSRERGRHVLAYLSPVSPWSGSHHPLVAAALRHPGTTFHVYGLPRDPGDIPANVAFHPLGTTTFDGHLLGARALICTAGHGMLSEAVHLGLPTLAVSGDVYEQRLNATVMEEAGHGMAATSLDLDAVDGFLGQVDDIGERIRAGKCGLFRGTGAGPVVERMMQVTI